VKSAQKRDPAQSLAGVGMRSGNNNCGMLYNLFFSLVFIAVILPAATQGAAEPSCDGRIRGQGEESSLVILKPDAVRSVCAHFGIKCKMYTYLYLHIYKYIYMYP